MNSPHSVNDVNNEVTAAVQLREALNSDDEQLIRDCIEGQTNLHEALTVLLEEIGEQQVLVGGLQGYINDLVARKNRIEGTVERLRSVVGWAMSRINQKTLALALGTVTRHAGRRRVVVMDHSKLPAELFDAQPAKLNMDRLRALMEEKDGVPGAEWSTSSPYVSIRRA